MNQATKDTTPFVHFKAMVADAAGLAIADLHRQRLAAAYDMGEPVWMVADEMKLRAAKPCKLPSPFGAACVRRVRV